jgi:hypothetical protein
MSQENVEAFKRGVDAMNHGDAWRDAINVMLGTDYSEVRDYAEALEAAGLVE